MEQIRVLQITETLEPAGIETFLLNLYRNTDKSFVQFDFLTLREKKEFYEEEILKKGGMKYSIKGNSKFVPIKLLQESLGLFCFLRNHHYDIVHFHFTTPLRALHLLIAYKCGAKVRIYHSHTANVIGKKKWKIFVYNLLKKIISICATDYFACSSSAAVWMFEKKIWKTNKYEVIKNGIEIEKFAFSSNARIRIRKELGIENKKVLIHVGRFSKEKNHKFLIELFLTLHQIDSSYRLLLLGDGELHTEIHNLIIKLGLESVIYMLGIKTNVVDYLSAADAFIMPSLFEGLPVSAIEAQCNGLPCILSNRIPDEVALTDNVFFCSISDKSNWLQTLQNLNFNSSNRSQASKEVKKNGYDIVDVSKKLQKFYMKKDYT